MKQILKIPTLSDEQLFAIKICESFGLINTTSQIQYNNGTLYFFDPETNTSYGIYKAGLYRRKRFSGLPYPLNKRNKDRSLIYSPGEYEFMARSLEKFVQLFRNKKS